MLLLCWFPFAYSPLNDLSFSWTSRLQEVHIGERLKLSSRLLGVGSVSLPALFPGEIWLWWSLAFPLAICFLQMWLVYGISHLPPLSLFLRIPRGAPAAILHVPFLLLQTRDPGFAPQSMCFTLKKWTFLALSETYSLGHPFITCSCTFCLIDTISTYLVFEVSAIS